MKIRRLLMCCAALAAAGPLPVAALDNALTYQGSLAEAGQPANGFYDFNFTLLSATGTPLAAPVFLDNIQVTQGVFSVALAFGYAFGSVDTELEVGVRPGTSTDAFTTMVPRQRIRPAPYAQHAERVAVGAVGSAQIGGGAIGPTHIAGGAITAAHVATAAIGSSHVSIGAIDSTRILDGAVQGADLAANAVTGATIATDTITAADIALNAVATSELADGAVSLAKISASGSAAGEVLASTGAGTAWVAPRPRRFYLTRVIPPPKGDSADAVCATGFHFASIFELADPGALRYDAVLGATFADSGSGPPISAGWVRSGSVSSSTDNCSAWTSSNLGSGLQAQLTIDKASQEFGPWSVAQVTCSFTAPSWCVED